MTPIPLITAKELRPLVALLTSEDRALIETWCERCRMWTEKGTGNVVVDPVEVRTLLQATVRLCNECLTHEAAHQARAVQVTLVDRGEQ